MENIIVGGIVFAATVYAIYRLLVRRDCGCGRGSSCCGSGTGGGRSGAGEGTSSSGEGAGSESGCACGK